MQQPHLSIAIPVRDAGPRLERTLASIAASREVDLSEIEVVVVDDGSSDGAVAAIRADTYPFPVTIERGAWGSQSAATNAAIALCRGRYVLLSAQDIRFEPGMLRAHLDAHDRFADETPGVAVLGTLPYAPEADTTPFTFYLVNGGFQFAYFLIHDPHHVPPNFLYAPNVSLRRETLERLGGFDENFPYGLQDTDLGIRLAADGVRLVHEPSAVGLHDHPMTLDAFRARMARIAPLRLLLEEKHPDHEPSTPSWDLVVSACLAYDDQRLELDLASIERLQPAVDARPAFRELWRRRLGGGLQVAALDEEDGVTLRLTDRLFQRYARVLQASWSGAYLDAAIERHGGERVEQILRARLTRLQAPRPAYRIVESALRRRGLNAVALAPTHCRSARVVHGIVDRATALAVLDRYMPPAAGAVDQELILLLPPGVFDASRRSEFERVAIVVEAEIAAGLARVAETVEAESLVVTDAASLIEESHAVELVERVLARFPHVAVLGGALVDDEGLVRYGSSVDGDQLSPMIARSTDERDAVPLDAPIAECLVLRRQVARAICRDEPGSPREPWTVTLGRAVRDSGAVVLHLPALVARRDPAIVSTSVDRVPSVY